ncbi:HesB/IscA family protein [Aliikangiella coralliicola]|uniref:Iron-sulfur cluster assembly accessory protein n=1 Tax=Aliikangiella coralliicola TaxID=2592383 RepID=A0A545UDG3_9GAMM|nr:iron-sulfur cluster assembly accessory protein [Aliikangiella coralliicola]TQV87505.1 iron-sulfur cluster assembly accessory protein [Aliikangiella coralliicola]
MTVATYNPKTTLPVSFTDTAIKHLSNQVAKRQAKGIEFNVKESGCSGYKYLLELCFEIAEDAIDYQLGEKLTLFISPKVIPLINGTCVDYIQEGVNFRLDFNNPNATALCGCGESFSVEQ